MTAPLNGRELLYNAYTQDKEKCRKEIKDIQGKAAAEKQTRTDASGIYTAPSNVALSQIRVLYVQQLSNIIFGGDGNKRAALMRYLLEKLKRKPSDLPLPECWAKLFDKIVDPTKVMKSDAAKRMKSEDNQKPQAAAQPVQNPASPAAAQAPPIAPAAPPIKQAPALPAKLPPVPQAAAKAPPKVPPAQPQVKQAPVPALRVAQRPPVAPNPQPVAAAQNQLTLNHLQQALANIGAPNQAAPPPQQVQARAQANAPAPLPAAQLPPAVAAANAPAVPVPLPAVQQLQAAAPAKAPVSPAQNDVQKPKAAAQSKEKSSGFVGFLKRCGNVIVSIVTYPFRLLKMLFTSNKQK